MADDPSDRDGRADGDGDEGWIFGDDVERDGRPNDREREREAAPLEDLARELDERRRSGSSTSPGASASTNADADSLFESVDVDELDSEAVWDSLLSEDDPEALGGDAAAVSPDDAGGRPEYVVSKREYCQRCQFFTDPPDVGCTYEGSEIVDVEDFERFRVRGCPVVAADDVDAEGTGDGDEFLSVD